jgi:macrolide-specific efflux system membrane fusion protein
MISTLFFVTAIGWAEPGQSQPAIDVEGVVVTVIEQVEVPARERGTITKLVVEEGGLVVESQILAQIDDRDAQLAKKRAEIELMTAEARLKNNVKTRLAQKAFELAETELQRGKKSRKLFEDSITDEELERRVLAVDKARLDIEQARHEHELAELQKKFSENELEIATRNIELRQIAAPIAGMIVKMNRRRGEWVEPGQTVVRILRIDRLRAEGFLNESQLTADLTGRPVRLVAKLPVGKTLELPGVLRFVSPEINPVDGRIRVWAEIENKDLKLRPGMRASMTIE